MRFVYVVHRPEREKNVKSLVVNYTYTMYFNHLV